MVKKIKDIVIAVVLLVYIIFTDLLPGPIDEIVAGLAEAVHIISIIKGPKK